MYNMREISAKELENLLNDDQSVNIIDVREVDEVATGKIPGAQNIPLGLIEFKMQELDKSKDYIVVCQAGGRSGRAVQFLESQGFKVTNMTGGMNVWEGKVE
jgi:rhodanese-related sulfurtransferase